MDNKYKKQITKLVKNKFGNIIENDFKNRIWKDDVFFDTTNYVNELLDKHTSNDEFKKLENQFIAYKLQQLTNKKSSEHFNKEHLSDSLDFVAPEFQKSITVEIINNLQNNSKSYQIRYLKELELYVEDFIELPTWINLKKCLESFLKNKFNRQIQILTLKVFQRLLFSTKQHVICESFMSLTETIFFLIDSNNSIFNTNVSLKGFETFNNEEKKIFFFQRTPNAKAEICNTDSEILLKCMLLLIKCQKHISGKWVRFNDLRLKNVIFSFIHLLASTTTIKHKKFTGLELISILNPTGNWCRYWCHTAAGRSLLCSALKKYKNFFSQIVEKILIKIEKKKNCSTPFVRKTKTVEELELIDSKRNKQYLSIEKKEKHETVHIYSAPITYFGKYNKGLKKQINSRFILENIPKDVIEEATFCHSLSLIVILIQFHTAQALFPVQASIRKRSISLQGLVSSIISYLNALKNFENDVENIQITSAYRLYLIQLLNTLEKIKN